MEMKFQLKVFFVLLTIALPLADVLAEADDGDRYLTVMGSYLDDDKERGVEDGFRGARIGYGYALNDYWNVEGAISQFDLDGLPGQKHFTIGADLQFVIARASRLSPYLFVGTSHINVDDDGTESTGFAWSGGAGLRIDPSKNSKASLQLEYRLRNDDALGPDLSDTIVSFGLHYPFGKKSAPAPAPAPKPAPAPAPEPEPVDSDRDGVIDDLDECPNTVAGAAVDDKGCELDSDGDGVVDRLDECPGTRAGAQVDIKGCEIKEEIRLPGVNFETNSDRLLPGAESVLNDAAASLVKNPSIEVEVAGHTDSDGSAEYNESLSARRAATVRDYLVSQGVSEDRMTARGYGELQPIADNTTREGKAQNRRVVLTITAR